MRLGSWEIYYRLIGELKKYPQKDNRFGSIFWGKYTPFYGGWEVLHVTSAIMSLIKDKEV